MLDALERAKQIAGGLSALARLIGTTPQAVNQWERVPVMRVLDVERVTGVPRHELRPDVYPPPEQAEVVSVSVFQIKSEEAELWCKQKHYARRVPLIIFAFGFYNNAKLEGIITFGSLATPQVRKGMFENDAFGENIIELNRLCIESEVKNAASILIGRSLRLLPRPKVVVSYADSGHGHIGYVYQATNFLYTGEVTAHDSEYLLNGKKIHPRTLTGRGITAPKEWAKNNKIEIVKPKPKHRYVYFHGSAAECRKMRHSIKYPIISDYPKGDTQRYDLGGPITTQGVFFV